MSSVILFYSPHSLRYHPLQLWAASLAINQVYPHLLRCHPSHLQVHSLAKNHFDVDNARFISLSFVVFDLSSFGTVITSLVGGFAPHWRWRCWLFLSSLSTLMAVTWSLFIIDSGGGSFILCCWWWLWFRSLPASVALSLFIRGIGSVCFVVIHYCQWM